MAEITEEMDNLIGSSIITSSLPSEEIVISGISGAFPNSMNVHEFRDNLFNKVNMVLPNRRWNFDHPEMPTCSGTIPEINRYDLGFFGVHERQSHSLDTMTRMLQEKTVEAIFDAGLQPSDFENTNTGVFVGVCFSENDKTWFFDNTEPQSYVITGSERSMIAHRLSYFLKLKGPSYTTDTACSSSLFALEHAYRAIKLGEIEAAIVGGANLCLHPFMTMQFLRLGVLSHDGSCKCFDTQGNGYARSEAITAIVMQKSKCAKRIYAKLVHVRSNCDGYKEQGITFPSAPAQVDLLTKFYDECGIDRYSLSYLETHGTGTHVGDPEECLAIDSVFTSRRTTPLLIGSVKSNIGHSEPASGLCSIIKCIIGMETGFIPPNIHFTTPRKEITGIIEKRLKVVVEKTPFEDNKGLLGVNSFGFGGGNCHVLLKWNQKKKIHNGLPKDDLPRLVCVSGRTAATVDTLIDAVTQHTLDYEFAGLLHETFRNNVLNHVFRGYTIVSKAGEMARSVVHSPEVRKPLYFSFGRLRNWFDIGCGLMVLPAFSLSLQKTKKYTLKCGIDICNVLFRKLPEWHKFPILGDALVQIAITDIFDSLRVKPKRYFGNSIGLLLAIHYSDLLTLEETINFLIDINETVVNNNYNNNKQESINGNCMGNENKWKVEVDEHIIQDFPSSLVIEKIFRNKQTPGHLSVKPFSKIENAELNSAILQIGNEAVAPFEDVSIFPIFKGNNHNHLAEFMNCIGRLYEIGYNPEISKLYPPVNFPVSRGTRMISPYIKWIHDKERFVPQFSLELIRQAQHGVRHYRILAVDRQWAFVTGHLIDGRNLFPATGYLYIVWDTFALIKGIPFNDMNVVFENCKFLRATTVPNKGDIVLQVAIHSGTGNFEVVEGDTTVVNGRIYLLNDTVVYDIPNFDDYDLSTYSTVKLKTKDVYKELRLRGYDYRGAFRGIQECSVDAEKGYIKWEANWVTFLDNMLQLKILQLDSRLLYVPIFIFKLVIKAKEHLAQVNEHGDVAAGSPNLPVQCDKVTGIIRSGGITIDGLIAKSIPRRKDLGIPVLEEYKFIPNNTSLNIYLSVRVNIQIILENALVPQVKAIELIDEFTSKNVLPLTPIIKLILEDQPLIQPFVKIFSKYPIDVAVEVEDRTLQNEKNCLLIIASNISERKDMLNEATAALVDEGFIISRESLQYDASLLQHCGVTILTVHRTSAEFILLLQKKVKSIEPNYLKITGSSNDFSWIPTLQDMINTRTDVVLYAEKEVSSGILGFLNCLRREPGNRHIKCVFLLDDNETFEPTHPFYKDQLEKRMAINVYKNNQWGTYRHLPINKHQFVDREHCFVNITARGDLSSLRWIEGPLRCQMTVPSEKTLVHVYYAALNFRDVMTATGKINADVITQQRLHQECIQGFEFSGRDNNGHRVMGMLTSGALSTLVLADSYLTFKMPHAWSLEEAATVPVVYGTLVYALARGQMKKGESILIHSGSGGVGQAAIRLASYYGCNIFTTVGNKDKREFLKKTFPFIRDSHIGSSRDETFVQMVLRETDGRGVDLALNSLAEEKLVASVKCLAKSGRLLEIGKYDMANNTHLNLLLFQKEASYHGVMLDQFFGEIPETKTEVTNIFNRALIHGAIQPLSRNVFNYDEIEQAFRFMMTGKHMGKVLIKIREPEKQLIAAPERFKFPGITRYLCDADKTYIIIGGLGGFGLELADWLVLRGARKIVLTSRKGITTGYQDMRVRLWKSYGTLVRVSTTSVTSKEGCRQLIEESLQLGPIHTIFNLAVELADSLFINQTSTSLMASMNPKAIATAYLDQVTREMCPNLRGFVVFSSVSCGRGNPGQTNYGMANSVMERISEQRKLEGYPAMAIEWGAIGEVGLVAEMLEQDTEIEISGTLQQKIASCFQVMDTFLTQRDSVIVSSMVVAEKRGINAADNIVDAVINILGLNDIKTISVHSTLAELGMDSMTGVEIKQVLERDFEVYLTAKDMRTMTLSRLKAIQEEKYGIKQNIETAESKFGLEMIFRLLGDESESKAPYLLLPSKVDKGAVAPKVLCLPGIEGCAKVYELLANKIDAHVVGLQFPYGNQNLSIVQMTESLMPVIEQHISETEPFFIVSYSYGTLIALEAVHILENRGYKGTIISLDGAPLLTQRMLLHFDVVSEQYFQTALVCHLLSFYVPAEVVSEYKESMFKCSSWEERLNLGIELAKDGLSHEANHLKIVSNGIYWRLKALMDYSPSYSKIESKIKLYKPKHISIQGLDEDYGLSKVWSQPVEIKLFNGNHVTFLEDESLAETINADIKNEK